MQIPATSTVQEYYDKTVQASGKVNLLTLHLSVLSRLVFKASLDVVFLVR